jgi:DNA helicase-2/ATP-dependent DNA helicase PcrA
MTPSLYQQAIYSWIREGTGHAVVEAVAGSGKTTTLVAALNEMKGKPLFCAFNKHIATELARRAPGNTTVSTIHSLGFAAIRKAFRNVEVDAQKTRKIVTDLMGDDFDDRAARIATENLVSLARLTLDDDLDAIIDHYSLDCNGDREWILETVPEVLRRDREETDTIDFDDMVYLPAALSLKPQQYDWVAVDEAQDLNAAQRELALSACSPGGRVCAVGDRFQSIYGFAGADTSSIPLLTEKLHAKSLPLSICYRCPTSHLDLARQIVPHIEARPGAPKGVVADYNLDEVVRKLAPGDLFICRVNAPLAEVCLALIRAGKKATLRGRDIGTNLVNLVKKVNRSVSGDIEKCLERFATYLEKETLKLTIEKKDGQADALRDRVETIYALADGVDTTQGLVNRIETIFSDDVDGIVCSSVHRAKGLEADRVAIYLPNLMPHPRAKEGWEMQQEMNLKYVSVTRAKQELWMVSK